MRLEINTTHLTAKAEWMQDNYGWQWQVRVYEACKYVTTLESDDMNWITRQLAELEHNTVIRINNAMATVNS